MDEEDDDFLDDATLTAALDAAEKAHQSTTTTGAPIAAANSGSGVPIRQPIPQKLSRGGISSIIVSTRQKGNPILSYIKNVPWEYGDITPDYVLGATTCALFLSLKYHRLHPEYIYNRMRSLGAQYKLRILLTLTDIDSPNATLQELTKTCLINNYTLILSWSPAESGRYLETYKSLEHTPPTAIMEKGSADYQTRAVEVVTQVRSVNKVDAVSLVGNFGSVRGAVNAKTEEIGLIPGWGPKKVERWEKAVGDGFKRGGGGRKRGPSVPPMQRQRQRQRPEDVEEEEEESVGVGGNETEGVLSALAKFREGG